MQRMLNYAARLALIALAIAPLAHAGNLRIVVNTGNEMSSVDKSEVKRIYTGRMTEWGKLKIVPINLTLDSEEAREFLKTYVGMTVQEYREYWVAQQIKGAGTAPMIQKAADNVKAMVSQIPGAIGYIPSADIDTTVKALSVE